MSSSVNRADIANLASSSSSSSGSKTSSVSSATERTCLLSSTQLIELLELAEEYAQLQLALREEMKEAIFKLASARRASSMGSVGSAAYRQTADDLREDSEPALTVALIANRGDAVAVAARSMAMEYELHYDDCSTKNALYMMNGLPPPALKKAQALFRGCAAKAVRLAGLGAQMGCIRGAAEG